MSAARVTAHYNAGNAGTDMGTTAQTMTLSGGARVAFGSPAWGAINSLSIRFRLTSGGSYRCYLHYSDTNNYLRARFNGSSLALEHAVGGTVTALATTSGITLGSNVWYWLSVTQFPAMPGEVCDVQASLLGDGPVAGTPGAVYAMAGPVPTSDAVTALTGQPQIEATGAVLILGGPSNNVHTVSLFGPGGWFLTGTSGAACASGAWEGVAQIEASGNGGNTYPNGPVSSFGALRLDAPPAGASDQQWRFYTDGTPTGSWAIPVSPAQTLAASVWVKSSGLSGTASISLTIREYNASVVHTLTGTFATVTGNQSGWVQFSGTYTTGAGCAYVDIGCRALHHRQ